MTMERKNPIIETGAYRRPYSAQVSQQAGEGDESGDGGEAVIKVDPNQVANDIASAAIGAVVGSVVTRVIYKDG